jgi:hydroxymethylpyrimidine pyrophosphatase-like HAD family hydrolase
MPESRPPLRMVREDVHSPGTPREPGGPSAALAVDLDRTLVRPGRSPPLAATRALREAGAMGLRVILVSGRTHSALAPFVEALGAVDGVVAENGAVVEAPRGQRPIVLGSRVAAQVHRRLRSSPELDVEFGTIVASVRVGDRERLRDLVDGLPVTLTQNVDRVMVLPAGITKSSGVHVALLRMGLGGRGFAAIGDGENDVPMLLDAALSGAVANATPAARAAADYRCKAPSARGVAEFVRGPLADWCRSARAGDVADDTG